MNVDQGGPIGPLEAAAVLAVLARFEEEQAILRSIAPQPLRQSKWVTSGRPRPIAPPVVARWSIKVHDADPVPPSPG